MYFLWEIIYFLSSLIFLDRTCLFNFIQSYINHKNKYSNTLDQKFGTNGQPSPPLWMIKDWRAVDSRLYYNPVKPSFSLFLSCFDDISKNNEDIRFKFKGTTFQLIINQLRILKRGKTTLSISNYYFEIYVPQKCS